MRVFFLQATFVVSTSVRSEVVQGLPLGSLSSYAREILY